MCMIFVCFEAPPPDEVLEAAADQNPDGAGIGWAPGDGKCHWLKGTNLAGIKAKMVEIELPYIIHFRKATSGGNTPMMTHPFQVAQNQSAELSGSGKAALLFHNGTWDTWKNALFQSVLAGSAKLKRTTRFPWSDSRALAWLAAVHGYGLLDIMDIKGGRVAILPPDRTLPVSIYGTWERVGENPEEERAWWSSRPVKELFKTGTRNSQHGACSGGTSGTTYTVGGAVNIWDGSRFAPVNVPQEGTSEKLCPICDEKLIYSGAQRVFCRHCNIGWAEGELGPAQRRKAVEKLASMNDDTRDALSAMGATTSETWTIQEMRLIYKDLKKRVSLLRAL